MHGEPGRISSSSARAVVVGGSLVRVELALSRALWRIGPAWAVLAGAVASGWAPADAGTVMRIVAAVALADLAWGSLRGIVPQGPIGRDLPDPSPTTLPYAEPGAPLARFLGKLAVGTGAPAARSWQPLTVSLALTTVLSLLLGPVALALSAGALSIVVLAWVLVANRSCYPAFSFALLDVAAPWVLGMSLTGSGAFAPRAWVGPIALLAGFTVLQWGVHRAGRPGASMAVGIWLGQAAVLLALVSQGQAWACALMAAALTAPSWWLLRGDSRAVARSLVWWWAAMGIAVVAAAQTT